MEIMTARQMKKAQKEERRLAEKQRKTNEVAKTEVIQEIIETWRNSDFWRDSHYILFYGEDDTELIGEVFENFDAYKRTFRKLGYKLKYESDCSGSGFSVSF